MLSGCIGFPNEAFPPSDLCSPKCGAACPTGALHNRRGAGLRERVRAAAYAVCRRRFAARRRGLAERKDVFAVCRGFRGLRKVVLRALTPARPVWRAPFPARSAADTGLRHTAGPAGSAQPSGRPALRPFWPAPEALAGMRLLGAQRRQPVLFVRDVVSARGRGKMCSSGAALRGNRKKGQPARDGRRHFCRRPQHRFCACFGRLRLLAGKHVCVPTAFSAADAESRQKEIFRPCGGRCGTAAGG
mgnify:CR=1 FL=1